MMLGPRWRKVLKDFGSNRIRTILVVLSIGVGTFAVGFVSNAYIILSHDLDAGFLAANPHSAVIYASLFDDEMVAAAGRTPGVSAAEGRSIIGARISGAPEVWHPVQFTSIPSSLEKMKIDRIRLEQGEGQQMLRDKELWIERTGLSLLPVQAGDRVKVELADGRIREMRVAGIVHDPTAFSSFFTGQVLAYVNADTLEWLGGSRLYSQMNITVAENPGNEVHVNNVAQSVASKIEKSGRQVFATVVFRPGEHPVKFITQTLMLVLGGLGVLAVFLSAFLVVNTINALLSQHTRQIGVMKAIGGRTDQIIGMYMVLVFAFGVAALLLAMVFSSILAYLMVAGLAQVLNFEPSGFRTPLPALLLQAVVALAMPQAAALVPVVKGARLTVREAISSYGLSADVFGQNWLDRALENIRWLSRPLLISLRNTFRRKARLALTLSTLTLGGAIFIAVFNLSGAFQVTIDQTLGYFLSDINVTLGENRRIESVEPILTSIPGVERVEAWDVRGAQFLSPDKSTAVDVFLWAPPADSQLIEPVLTAGRWLLPEDENAMVIGNHLIKKRPDLKVGDEVVTRLSGHEFRWVVVGIYQMAGNVEPPFVFVNNEYLSCITNNPGRSSEYRIVTSPRDGPTQRRVAAQIEALFGQAGINLASMMTGVEIQAQQANQINILVNTLMVMAVLIAVVGGLGLMGTMSMNVLERTREIGVMRSIGASNRAILSLVVVEGMIIGILSWLFGSLLSLPISKVLGELIGYAFVNSPLEFVFSLQGLVIWLVIVVVISALASLLPAMNAARLTVRDVLAYE